MMRCRGGSLALLAACGLLAFDGPVAGSAHGAGGTDVGAHGSDRIAPARTWSVTLSPSPDDLVLAQISFRRNARNRAISARSVRLAAVNSLGDDYLAVATPRSRTAGWLRLLVLLVNRPSPLLDPVDVRLRLTARSALGTPVIRKLTDPFADGGTGTTPLLCDLPVDGRPVSGSELFPLRSQGAALPGFDAASAVAQAYDAVCRAPQESAFRGDVTGQIPTVPAPVPSPPGPSPPSPAPPVGVLPGEGCTPTPGYACPGAVRSRSAAVDAAASGCRPWAAIRVPGSLRHPTPCLGELQDP
jgi:hypothetical protein